MGGLGGRGTPPAPAEGFPFPPVGPCPLATQEPYGHRQQREGFPFPPKQAKQRIVSSQLLPLLDLLRGGQVLYRAGA